MLRDHPDPGRDRVLRRVDRDRPAVDEDRAGVGPRQPVEDPHQRRLAGAVLAEQRVHLAARDGEVDAVVGDELAEALGDAAQLDGGRVAPPAVVVASSI